MARASETFFDAGKTNNLDLAMLDDPEAALAALAGDAPARSLVARGASGESRGSGEDGYSDRSSTTSEGHHYEDDASETPSKTPEVTKLSVKTAPATGELYVVSGELPTVCGALVLVFGTWLHSLGQVLARAHSAWSLSAMPKSPARQFVH